MTRQLALPFAVRSHLATAAFVPGQANADACTWLAEPQLWPAGRLALFGPAGTGKTHLLHMFAARLRGVLLPGEAVRTLVDLPAGGAVAVDDADVGPEPEALLHLLNAASEAGLPVLLAGRTPPSAWAVGLPDLASRLRAVTAVAVGLPDDALLEAMLASLLAERQLRVEPGVQAWLLARLPRDGAALREAVVRLDRASLADGRRVTRGTAAYVVARFEEGEEEVGSKKSLLF